ncbi:nucleotide exchange factor GrpE [Thermus filiformis]|uniref:Protein GrpE n=1 Tax=Thermus filiformis TaxID=276 RepID=A0A0D6XCM5_THEFI|nr:nucleotide exchange factor GrpE [Thermus filiformis]KIX84628.1 molecular chaperone GrpE [Thermus filiformis]
MDEKPESTKDVAEPLQDMAALGQEVARLEEELARAQGEVRSLKDQYLRLLADFDNYRKRMEAELQRREEEGALRVLRALLPVLDDLERALEFAEADPGAIRKGVQAVRDGFYRILAGLGVEEVPGEGAAFDPRYHEAIGVLEGEPGKVARVFQKGFRKGEALVRPARVAVGEAKGEEEGVK